MRPITKRSASIDSTATNSKTTTVHHNAQRLDQLLPWNWTEAAKLAA